MPDTINSNCVWVDGGICQLMTFKILDFLTLLAADQFEQWYAIVANRFLQVGTNIVLEGSKSRMVCFNKKRYIATELSPRPPNICSKLCWKAWNVSTEHANIGFKLVDSATLNLKKHILTKSASLPYLNCSNDRPHPKGLDQMLTLRSSLTKGAITSSSSINWLTIRARELVMWAKHCSSWASFTQQAMPCLYRWIRVVRRLVIAARTLVLAACTLFSKSL